MQPTKPLITPDLPHQEEEQEKDLLYVEQEQEREKDLPHQEEWEKDLPQKEEQEKDMTMSQGGYKDAEFIGSFGDLGAKAMPESSFCIEFFFSFASRSEV